MTELFRHMGRFVLFGLAFLWLCTANNAIAQSYVEGDVVTLIEEIRNQMPGMGTNAFIIPSDAQMEVFGNVLEKLEASDFTGIQSMLDPYGYTFIRYHQVNSTDTLYILKENYPVQRGWGTYIYKPSGALDLAIEVPHPIWDTKSWKLGIHAFLRLDAQWFFMSGTHRYANTDSSSDVAHVTRSVFHRAHQTVATERAIQIHGFNNSDPSYDGYPDIVISAGNLYPPNILFILKLKFEAKYFPSGVYSISTQSALSKLAATTNKQGQWSNANGKSFVHIEFDTPIRTDSVNTLKAIEALVETFGNTSAIRGEETSSVEAIKLYQNYPNPFNPVTTIRFEVNKYEYASLSIVDLRGSEVAVITQGMFIPGVYTFTWDALHYHVASGLYFSVLRTHGQTQIQKMVLVQ